jgi:hypothetical protein
MEKKYKYCQIDYPHYPSEKDLNELGEIGWELVCIEGFAWKFFDSMLESSSTKKIYKATFKREIVYDETL